MASQIWKFTTSEFQIKPQLGGDVFPELTVREPVSLTCLDSRLAQPEAKTDI